MGIDRIASQFIALTRTLSRHTSRTAQPSDDEDEVPLNLTGVVGSGILTTNFGSDSGRSCEPWCSRRHAEWSKKRGWAGEGAAGGSVVGLTDQTLSCAARAYVAAAARHAACLHLKRAMQAA